MVRHLAAGFGLVLLVPLAPRAAVFQVTSTADSGGGTLRHAVEQASSAPDGPHTILVETDGPILLESQIEIRQSLTIRSPGPERTISGQGRTRHFETFDNFNVPVLTLSNLCLREGFVKPGYNPFGGTPGYGGSVFVGSFTRLHAQRCRFIDNTAFGGDAILLGGIGEGGAIEIDGSATLEDCTFAGNRVDTGSPVAPQGDPSFGAAVHITSFNGGPIVMDRCSFVGNRALSGYGQGGGVCLRQGVLLLTNCAFAGNQADTGAGLRIIESEDQPAQAYAVHCTFENHEAGSQGGGCAITSGQLHLTACLFVNNRAPAGPDVSGTIQSSGHNLLRDAGVSGLVDSDLRDIDPLVLLLAHPDSAPPYIPLRPNSPARDAIPARFTDLDQRLRPRPASGTDIGAVEAEWHLWAEGSGQTAAVGFPFTTPLRVLTAEAGRPFALADAPVTFQTPATGPSGQFVTNGSSFSGETDAMGALSAPSLIAAAAAGPWTARAESPGFAAALFFLTNAPGSDMGSSNGRLALLEWEVKIRKPKRIARAKDGPDGPFIGRLSGRVNKTQLPRRSSAVAVQFAFASSHAEPLAWSEVDRVRKVNRRGSARFRAGPLLIPTNAAPSPSILLVRASTNFSVATSPTGTVQLE